MKGYASSSYGSSSLARANASYARSRSRLARQPTRMIDTSMYPVVGTPVQAVYGRPGGPELKGCDAYLEDTVINTTNSNMSAIVVNLIQPGTGSWNRVGRKITMQSLRIKGIAEYIFKPTTTLGNLEGSVMRMVVVYDRQVSGGAIPTFDTIFGTTDQAGTESTLPYDPLKYDNMGRFTVLRDVLIEANPETYSSAGGTQDKVTCRYPIDEYVKLGGLETIYSGQSSPCTIADISTGALYVYFRALNDTMNEQEWNIPSLTKARLRYYD